MQPQVKEQMVLPEVLKHFFDVDIPYIGEDRGIDDILTCLHAYRVSSFYSSAGILLQQDQDLNLKWSSSKFQSSICKVLYVGLL